jgi:hypothetical protein
MFLWQKDHKKCVNFHFEFPLLCQKNNVDFVKGLQMAVFGAKSSRLHLAAKDAIFCEIDFCALKGKIKKA